MSESYKKLVKTLQTIFEMDKADLDFGIYRIMNQKRDDINRFLEDDLLPQVKQAFEEYNTGGLGELQQELAQAIVQAKNFGAPDPESTPVVLDIKTKMANAVDPASLENDVFSKLQTFFSRYYDKGDFISQRRYKADTYAIPYEGEEVKLYWANHDQYYIKSSEHLRDYAFLAKEGGVGYEKSVRIKLIEADTEKDNSKAKPGEERRFVLDDANPLSEENGELLIHFNFNPAGKKSQEKLNELAVATIFEQEGFDDWLAILKAPMPTEKNKDRTLLARHLNEYTARNTFDYFIHKDLGGFLNRELDFFIKNEVLFLDDIDDAAFNITEQQLRKIKVIRSIAKKIIRMLALLENFQKKLWLKKKFVVETNYCITLDLIPFDEALFEKIFSNEDQLGEWEELFAIDRKQLDRNYELMEWTEFLSVDKYSNLPVDTRFYNALITDQLVSLIDNIDEKTTALLINADNFQAARFLSGALSNKVECMYLDPPYNAPSSEILYKNSFKHSSWLSFFGSRLEQGKKLLSKEGVLIIAIDDNEQERLGMYLSDSFPAHERTCVSIVHNPAGVQGKNFSSSHEYAYFIFPEGGKYIGEIEREEPLVSNLRDWGGTSSRNLAKTCFYPIIVKDNEIVGFGAVCDESFHPGSNNVTQGGLTYIYPVDSQGVERKWVFSRNSVEKNDKQLFVKNDSGVITIMRTKHTRSYRTVWDSKKYYANIYGSKLITAMFGKQPFSFPKSLHTVEDSIRAITTLKKNGGLVMDYFAGSGTTGHAVITTNRRDKGSRKFVLVEQGEYFKSVTKPRVQKAFYSSEWKAGSPTLVDSQSYIMKDLRLESYEDALNNIDLIPNASHKDLLESSQVLKEEYMLGYWLDVETTDSPSLLNVQQFEDPFNYKLNIGSGSVGATKATTVDLVETFNYLIGLTVKEIDVLDGFKVVTGTNPQGDSVLVIWRKIKEKDNAALERFLHKKLGVNPREHGEFVDYDHIYVNGDHTLEDPQSKVKMTEIEFKRLMFDVSDV